MPLEVGRFRHVLDPEPLRGGPELGLRPGIFRVRGGTRRQRCREDQRDHDDSLAHGWFFPWSSFDGFGFVPCEFLRAAADLSRAFLAALSWALYRFWII